MVASRALGCVSFGRVGGERWAVLASASCAHAVRCCQRDAQSCRRAALMGGELQGTDDVCCRVSFFVTVALSGAYAVQPETASPATIIS